MSERPEWISATSVEIGGQTYVTKPHREDRGFDRFEAVMVPRWKESELSGDEWRWSHSVRAYRKGRVIAQSGGLSLFEAIVRILPELQRIEGWSYLGVDECAQPACEKEPAILFKLRRVYDRSGFYHADANHYVRPFCPDHIHRGDCGMEDNDDNYERIGLRLDGEWVPYPGGDESVVRSATRAEILEALGGEEVWWCEEHRSRESDNGLCEWMLLDSHLHAFDVKDCRMARKRLVDVEEQT